MSHAPLPWRFVKDAQDPAGRKYAWPAPCLVAADGSHPVCSGHHYDEGGELEAADAELIVKALEASALGPQP